MTLPGEASRDDEHARVLAEAVADAVTTPLLAAVQGDSDRAWLQWLSARIEIDRVIKKRLERGRSLQGATLLDALGVSLATGVGDATSLIERAVAEASSPAERADAQRAAAKLGTWCGNILRTASLTHRTAEEIRGIDDERAAALWLDEATALAYFGHLPAGAQAAFRARQSAEPKSQIALASYTVANWIKTLQGEVVPSGEPDEELLSALGDDDVRLGVMFAEMLVWSGQHDAARHLLGRVEADARSNAPDTLPFVLGVVADLDYRSGWWRSADEAVAEAEMRTRHNGARNIRGMILARGARVDAARGDTEKCLSRLAEAERIAQQGALLIVQLHIASIRALLGVGAGDYELTVTEGRRVESYAREMGLCNLGMDQHQVDLVEALVHLGAIDEARALVADLQARTRNGAPIERAFAARARLLVCDDAEVEAIGAEAHAAHQTLSIPFERARTSLLLGERHRRLGARRAARIVLDQARSEFSRLGAAPWCQRAGAELRAAGGRIASDGSDADRFAMLTPQEQRVAMLVADGATNQEVASAMFLNVKSIERHLTSIYRKLEIRSRTELGREIDRARRITQP